MRNLARLRLTVSMLLVAILSLPGTASAMHTLTVVDGPPKFNPAFFIMSVAPYCVFGILALVIFRGYRRQQ